jgi:phage terminase large subunit-like protein
MPASGTSLEECGYTWDEVTCPERGPHLCVPRAARAVGFYQEILVHTKGRYARKPFLLAPWQRDEIIVPLFGSARWEDQLEEYVRQFTLAWIELARKNGKSELVAGGGLLLLCGDDEEEAEIYGAAKDRDQAGVVYQVAKRMVELSPVLSNRLTVIDSKKRIIDPKTGSFYQVVASDAGGNLGKNPSGILFDEVITQPNRELWDDLRTGAGARDQTLMIAATTAGNDPAAMAAEEHLHSERVLADPSVDPARFVFMRNMPADADWTDEKTWYYPNPALGDFLRIQVLRDEAKEAELSPRKQNTLFQFRFNRWVRQVTRWLDMGLWDENAGLVVPEKLKGRDAYGGLDLASTSDFAAWVLVFPGAIREAGGVFADGVLARFWLPQAAVDARKDMAPLLKAWAREGFLSITPGDVISLGDIRRQIDLDMRSFRVRRIGYDRWGATEVTQWMRGRLGEDQVVGIPQTTLALNAPSKELERRLGLRQLRHGGHPVLRWMADNVQAFTDSGGNIKPDRKNSKEKIDGIAALVDALYVETMPKQASFAFVLGTD